MKYVGEELSSMVAFPITQISGEGLDVAGSAVDRKGFESCVFHCQVGASSGTPTEYGVIFKVQECATEDGSFTDVEDDDSVDLYTATITGEPGDIDGTGTEINVPLGALDRYVRLSAKPVFNGGDTPKVYVAASCVLGEAKTLPV